MLLESETIIRPNQIFKNYTEVYSCILKILPVNRLINKHGNGMATHQYKKMNTTSF